MTIACSHRLDGLEPDNLLAFLAFLALLGLLRALEAGDRARPDGDTLRPRAAWDLDHPPLRPRLFLARERSREDVSRRAAEGVETLVPVHDFGGRKDLTYPKPECRSLLQQDAKAARRERRERADLLAALMSDAAVKDAKGEVVDPTPLCLLSGQGHQHFLARLASVPREAAPPRAAEESTPSRCPPRNA